MRIIKYITVVAAILMVVSSCADWIRPESLTLDAPTLEEQNPELWEQYLASLREYKQSEHNLTMVRFNNPENMPFGQHQHLAALPDSVDYVILECPDNISDFTRQEIEQGRRMGTKYLFTIDFKNVQSDYDTYLTEWEEAHAPVSVEGEDEAETAGNEAGDEEEEHSMTFAEFAEMDVKAILETKDAGLFDGIIMAYEGKSPTGMPEGVKAEWTEYQNAFFTPILDWIDANDVKDVFFYGIPQNVLYDAKIFNYLDYVIVDNLSAKSIEALTFNCRLAVDSWLPSFKMIVDVTYPSITDPADQRGWFVALGSAGEKTYAIDGAAKWVLEYDKDMYRAGICVTNAQQDYFHTENNYKVIRGAISTMNWSPAL